MRLYYYILIVAVLVLVPYQLDISNVIDSIYLDREPNDVAYAIYHLLQMLT